MTDSLKRYGSGKLAAKKAAVLVAMTAAIGVYFSISISTKPCQFGRPFSPTDTAIRFKRC
jgi:hypothetical protein